MRISMIHTGGYHPVCIIMRTGGHLSVFTIMIHTGGYLCVYHHDTHRRMAFCTYHHDTHRRNSSCIIMIHTRGMIWTNYKPRPPPPPPRPPSPTPISSPPPPPRSPPPGKTVLTNRSGGSKNVCPPLETPGDLQKTHFFIYANFYFLHLRPLSFKNSPFSASPSPGTIKIKFSMQFYPGYTYFHPH